MKRESTSIRLVAIFCCLAGLASAAHSAAQASADDSPALKVRILSASEMPKEDADLLRSRRAEVARAAEFDGYDLTSGTWTESEVLCPYAPNHMIVHYRKTARNGGVSLFTAVIPRGNRPVRIIPVMYSGGQALKIFGLTQSQRDLINEVISTKPAPGTPDENADWATLGYCYASLTGAEPARPGPTLPDQTTAVQTAPGEITPSQTGQITPSQNAPSQITPSQIAPSQTGQIAPSQTPEDMTPQQVARSTDGRLEEMNFTAQGPDHFRQYWKVEFDRNLQMKSIEMSTDATHEWHMVPGQSQPRFRPVPNTQPGPPGVVPAAPQ